MSMDLQKEINRIWRELRLVDRRRLAGYRKRLLLNWERDPDSESVQQEKEKFFALLHRAEKRSLFMYAKRIKCEFPPELPVSAKIPEIRKALRENGIVIVCGSTGSGKTTQLPKAALMEGFGRSGRIGCTQPRRIAASALAQRLADETGVVCGQEIGYKVRFDDHTLESTVIKFMTDGILLAETRDDPNLYQYDCIMLDEVHERSLNIDFLLGYMKLLKQRRPDLRLIISSATLDAERISDFFGGAPVIEVEGRLYPVEDVFIEPDEDEELAESIARGVEFASDLDAHGDILVFLPGEREIRAAADLLTGRNYPNTEILPLFGRLSAKEQGRIFTHSSQRRIVLATNVAETSLTIPGIKFAVDSALVRLSRYNPKSRIQELRIEQVSKASAFQRRGRCGRVQDGVCIHLCSESAYEDFPDYTDPEIQRSSLAGVILQMASLNLPPIEEFPFIDPPGFALIREGMTVLTDLRAIDENGKITESGQELASLPLDPHLGAILLAGERYKVLKQIAVIVGFLSIVDPRERPFEKAKEADYAQKKFQVPNSDFLSILKLWLACSEELEKSKSNLRKFAKANYLNFRRIMEWRNLTSDLLDFFEINDMSFEYRDSDGDQIHKSLLTGLARQLSMYDKESKLYSDRAGKKSIIFPGSALAKLKNPPDWIMSFATVETTRVFARCCAEVKPEWLEDVAPHLCSMAYDRIAWDERSGFVQARERVMSGCLVIHPGRRCHYGRIDPAKAREVFIREALVPAAIQTKAAPWLAEYNAMMKRFSDLEIKMRRPDSIINAFAIEQYFRSVLPPHICSVESVKRDWLTHRKSYIPKPDDILYVPVSELHEDDFPDFIISNGERINLDYAFDPGEPDDGITARVAEADLNLLNPHFMEYLVPGYLRWKMDDMIRALPKAIRKELIPVSGCIEQFILALKEDRLFTEQPFIQTLSGFLADEYSVEVGERAFEFAVIPESMVMKLALLDHDGKVRNTVREFPNVKKMSSTLSISHDVSKQWQAEDCDGWPRLPELPEKLVLNPANGKIVYPALFREKDSELIGCSVFLKQPEAQQHHEQAVFQLCRLHYPQMFKQIRKSLSLQRDIEAEFFSEYKSWKDDLMNNALRLAFACPVWQIRSAKSFEQAVMRVRDHFCSCAADVKEELDNVFTMYAPVEKLFDRIPDESWTMEDVNMQLGHLFRPGFLCVPDLVKRYPRYLKALRTRLERADGQTAKDRQKGEWIAPYIKKLHLALEMDDKSLEERPSILNYLMYVQEARIAAFTPEIPTLCKVSPKMLEQVWSETKLS